MRVRVKNNRLSLEGSTPSFSALDDLRLAQLAGKYQIGTQKVVKRSVDVSRGGRTVEEERMSYEKKPRAVLGDEIRKYISVTIDIPKEYWTEEQLYAWESNNVEEMKEISEINQIKTEAGILSKLPPFEEGLDNLQTSRLLFEMTESQWEWVSDHYNFKITLEENKEGGVTKKKTYVPRLVVHEWIPENDEDKARLEEMKETKAVKMSKEKHVKKDSGKK